MALLDAKDFHVAIEAFIDRANKLLAKSTKFEEPPNIYRAFDAKRKRYVKFFIYNTCNKCCGSGFTHYGFGYTSITEPCTCGFATLKSHNRYKQQKDFCFVDNHTGNIFKANTFGCRDSTRVLGNVLNSTYEVFDAYINTIVY